jgi:plastocyanin
MKNIKPTAILVLVSAFIINACTKHEGYTPAGGNLPTNYITVLPNGTITPSSLSVASGSSITFVNTHNKPHRILSLDADSSIYTPVIPPDSSFFFKNDTLLGTFAYKCVLDSTISGVIRIRP